MSIEKYLSNDRTMSRRHWLGNVYTGLAGIGLAHLGAGELCAGGFAAAGRTHHPAKAKRVLQIFCPGAASHMDLWEHKPALEKYSGQPLPGEEEHGQFSRQEWQPDEESVAVRPERRNWQADLQHAAAHESACG